MHARFRELFSIVIFDVCRYALANSLEVCNFISRKVSFLNLCFLLLRILEAVLIVMVTTVSIFLIATLLGTCVHERADDNEEYICPGLTVEKCSHTLPYLH